MPAVNSVTFIYDDGSTEEVFVGNVFYDKYEQPKINLPLSFVPNREYRGMDVVAAHEDGTVETAFTVGHIGRASGQMSEDEHRIYAPFSQ